MPSSSHQKPIEYGILTADDVDAMAHLLSEAFSRRAPPAVAGQQAQLILISNGNRENGVCPVSHISSTPDARK